ncbi:MAG: alkaline phosphatase family protein, partial [Nitrospiria bacterium]
PDLCNDMHGHDARYRNDLCSYRHPKELISRGDTFLGTWVNKIMLSRTWTEGSVIFITWDESDFSFKGYNLGCCSANPGGGHTIIIAISDLNSKPRSSSIPYNHYSLLATIEDNWALGCLANTCSSSVTPMKDLVSSEH